MLKKFLSVVMVGTMILSLTACGGGNNPGKFTKMPSGKQGYLLNDNSYAKSMWVTHSGKEYYFNSDGELCTNQYVDGKLVDAKGAMIKKNNEFFNFVNGKTYYVQPNGDASSHGVYEVNGEEYALNNGKLGDECVAVGIISGKYYIENLDFNQPVDEGTRLFGVGGKQIKKGGIYNYQGKKIVLEDNGFVRSRHSGVIVNVDGVDYCTTYGSWIKDRADDVYIAEGLPKVFCDSEGKLLKAKNEYAIVKYSGEYCCIDEQGYRVETGELVNPNDVPRGFTAVYKVAKKDGSFFCYVGLGYICMEDDKYIGGWRKHNGDGLNVDYDLTK